MKCTPNEAEKKEVPRNSVTMGLLQLNNIEGTIGRKKPSIENAGRLSHFIWAERIQLQYYQNGTNGYQCIRSPMVLGTLLGKGYTPEYMSTLFSDIMRISIHHYLMQVRIDHAKELLKNTDPQIKEISFECGFKSIHHFSRSFKEFQGKLSAAWREHEQEEVWKNVVISPGFINTDITITESKKRRIEQV